MLLECCKGSPYPCMVGQKSQTLQTQTDMDKERSSLENRESLPVLPREDLFFPDILARERFFS